MQEAKRGGMPRRSAVTELQTRCNRKTQYTELLSIGKNVGKPRGSPLGLGGKGLFSVCVSTQFKVKPKVNFRSSTYHSALLYPTHVVNHLGSTILSLTRSLEP